MEGTVVSWLQQHATSQATALLLEPNLDTFIQLVANFNASKASLTFAQAAVNVVKGASTLYVPVPGQEEFSSLASLSEAHINQHLERVSKWHKGLQKVKDVPHKAVRVSSFDWDTLIDVYGVGTIGHLIIDTEGLDCRLLVAFPFHRLRPQLISFEHAHCDGPFSSTTTTTTSADAADTASGRPLFRRAVSVLAAHGYVQLLPYNDAHVLLFDEMDAHFTLAAG